MEPVTWLFAGLAGIAANLLADEVKKWLSTRLSKRGSTLFEIRGPTGTKFEVTLQRGQSIDPSAIKKTILEKMLRDPKYQFREGRTLQSAIAADEKETKELLLQIGARHNIKEGGEDTWTLQEL